MDLEPESPESAQLSEEKSSLPQSYAFTVHFDNGKQSGSGEMPSKFSRKHIRNLSLPISKVYESKPKVTNENPVNGRITKKAGNHSEGYFSSDAEDDSKPKLFEVKHKNCDNKGFKTTNAAQEKRSTVPVIEKEREDETNSDVASEAGTYTIDKDSPEVVNARQSIDNVFNVQVQAVAETKSVKSDTNHSSSTWVSEWASSVVEHNHHSSLDSNSSSSRNSGSGMTVTKIPSPVNIRSRLPPATQPFRSDHERVKTPLTRKSYPLAAQDLCSNETESYLRATERVVSALAARVSLSLDSGGESDIENSLGHVPEPQGHTDSSASASDSGNTVRYNNKAFSLRRGRLEDPKKKPVSPAVTNKSKVEPVKAIPARVVKRDPPTAVSPNFARTDCGRFSMRSPRPTPQSPLMSNVKKEVVKKKSVGGGSARSNSTLSSKEVEFQNWKRRKSYDPMKAAAEGKKKEAAKKQPPSVMTQSINSTLNTPKSPVNPVLRSASFHGTRQLMTASSSEEEEEEAALSPEDEDWPVLQAPRTSLENIHQESRVSLYSNASNSPTPSLRNRPKLEEMKKQVVIKVKEGDKEEGVDTLVISALATLSSKLKGNSCHLLNKLRFLYDEESPKNHQLGAMIDQLEASEPGSPQVKSPSRELATTLRNLKRLESMLKVLDEVLFDEEEFQ